MGDKQARALALGLILLAGAAAGLAALDLRVSTDLTHFFPASEDASFAALSRELPRSELSKSITLTLAAPSPEEAAAASRALAERFGRRPEVAWVRSGTDEDLSEAFYTIYFDRRLRFLSRDPASLSETLLSDEGLDAASEELAGRLASPMGTFVRQIAPTDPWLAFPRHLERLRNAQAGLETVNGQFVTEDGHGVIFAASHASPFDGAASRRMLEGLDEDFAAVHDELGVELELERSGLHRFAVRSEASMRADLTRISIVSTLAVILFFIWIFRSPRLLLASLLPLGVGLAVGLATTRFVFGGVHALTLAFGSTLIGVCIDYVVHTVNHHVLDPHPDGPRAGIRAIWPALLLGAATTVVGLAALAWAGFAGLREMSVFTSSAVTGALLATRFVLVPLLPRAPEATATHRRLTDALGRAIAHLRGSKLALSIAPGLAILIIAIGLPRLSWIDDIRALDERDEALVAEEERVQARVSRTDGARFVVAFGADDEAALAANDAAALALDGAIEAGELEARRSLSDLIFSRGLQDANLEAVRAAPDLFARTTRALERAGFVAEGFAPFEAELSRQSEALDFETLAASPIGPMIRSFRIPLEGEVAILTLIRGADLEALERRLAEVEGVRVFDQGAFMEDAYRAFRTRTLELTGLGLLGVFLLVLLRHRRLGPALAAFIPAVLAAGVSLAVLGLAGHHANLMHAMALLLVLSMGVDYGVFMVESQNHPEGPAPTMTSLLVACVSTVLSFGLLAMSDSPAMQALGLVTSIGVLASLVLAPTAWLLLADRKVGS